jgi:hypothetical protein
MLAAGLLNAAMTGELPGTGKGSFMDYFFPRDGSLNPNGSQGRMTTMFNTREVPMLLGHIQAENSVMAGLGTLLQNKMVLGPLAELYHNRDFFGNKLADPNAPAWKRVGQTIDSTLGQNLKPITFSSSERYGQRGGGYGKTALSIAGFGPAPSYITNTPIQNRIAHVYGEEAAPYTKPYEYGANTGLGKGLVQDVIRGQSLSPFGLIPKDLTKSEARREGRSLIQQGTDESNPLKAAQGRAELVTKGGMSPTTVNRLRPGDADVFQFNQLPVESQKALAREMTQAEWNRYVPLNRQLTKAKRIELIRDRATNVP